MPKTLEVRVTKLGDVKIDAEGFVGEECKTATQALENALAGNTQFKPKPEFYETPSSATQEQTQRL